LVLITSFVLNLSSPAYNIEVEKSHFDETFYFQSSSTQWHYSMTCIS